MADNAEGTGLFVMNSDGSDFRSIACDSASFFSFRYCSPSWSPTGDNIAYLSLDDNPPKTQWIILIDPETTETDTIAEFNVPPEAFLMSVPIWEQSLCWSPDGTKIAFTRLEGYYVSHICLVNIDTGEITQVTFEEDARDCFISWSK